MSDPGDYTHVPRNAALIIFEQLARDYFDGKRDFPLDLLPDLLRAYLELLDKVRTLDGAGSMANQTTDVVNLLISLGVDVETARTKVAEASGSPRDTVKREHNKRTPRGGKNPAK